MQIGFGEWRHAFVESVYARLEEVQFLPQRAEMFSINIELRLRGIIAALKHFTQKPRRARVVRA